MEAPKPVFKEEASEAEVKIHINARNMKEAKQMLSGLNRKYPSVNLEEIINSAEAKSSYCPDMFQFNLSFGGQNSGRSIVKSAFSLAVESGVSPCECEHAREYLLNEDGEACFGYYYEKDLVINRPDGIPLHCVYVQGDSSNKLILAYIEFFGTQRMVACLSSNYSGKDFTNSYSIDPVSGNQLNLDIDLGLTLEDIRASYRYEKIPQGSIEAAFSRVVPVHMQAHQEQERERVIRIAVEKAFKQCGAAEGDLLTPEHMKKVVEIVTREIGPVMVHQMGLNTRRV
jgi:hypothetical protein